ncbi:MAG: GH25 family lysozyme [Bacteroidales bacterium]|nr:GH25 family lysozyme [Bacteroidales bacterium]
MGRKRLKKKYRKPFRIIVSSVVLAVLGIIFIPKIIRYYQEEDAVKGLPDYPFSKNAVIGIDVSVHQGQIDWDSVEKFAEKPISFVYIKASEGATKHDICYNYNLENARDKGLLVGSYHYFKANRPAEKQFSNFLTAIDTEKQDLAPLIDVEEMNGASQEEFHSRLSRFVQLVEEHFGRKPIIYSQNHFFNRHLADKYNAYPLMIARYHCEKPKLEIKSEWAIWQFTEKGKVEGIKGFVDINILNNVDFDLDDLKL